MTQNRPHAVMAQRFEAHDSLDHFPTPPGATRALCEWLKKTPMDLSCMAAWEPACAEGHMARPLKEYFGHVYASDVHDYGHGHVDDFLWPTTRRGDWIITNPPFRLGEQFCLTAIDRSAVGCAMLVRTAFLEGAGRFSNLFSKAPPSDVLQFVERVPMVKGRLDKSASTATSYCWLVWRHGSVGETKLHWVPPCRRALEREADYGGVA